MQINFKLRKSLHQNFTLGSFDINYANSGINKSTAAVRPGANYFNKNSTRPVESGVNRR
jgi:hypothetical protein